MTSTIISDVRTKNALPYGGIPFDLITKHYEQTDPALIAASKYTNAYDDDPYSDYDNYVRAEIVDWSPDVPYFESDHARRDPSLSKSQLNLRYNSTRGSRPELPRHPEMFIGFIENDPRGALIDPRLDDNKKLWEITNNNIPWIWHYGLLDFEKKAARNRNFWAEHWKVESGREVEVELSVQDFENKYNGTAKLHNLPIE